MRVLVIGGTRMIGHYLIPQLLARGDDVTVLSRGNRPPVDSGVRRLLADRRDAAQLRAALAGHSFDAVIDDVAYEPQDAQALLGALSDRFGHYVLTSTVFVYPQLDAGKPVLTPLREDAWDFSSPAVPPAAPEHLRYVDGKRRLEAFLASESRRSGRSVTIVRPHLQLAGSQTEDGRFAWFWLRVRDGGPIWLPEGAASPPGPCQMAYAGDVAAVLSAAAHRPPGGLRVYHAAASEVYSYQEYIASMAQAAGATPTLRFAPRAQLDQGPFASGGVYRVPLPYIAVCDVRRAEQELGVRFTPRTEWMPKVGAWVDAHYRSAPIPPWYALRDLERATDRM